MKQLREIVLVICLAIAGLNVQGQNDPTTDRWQDDGANLITSPTFNGRVGIGLSNPSRRLTVFSPSGGVATLIESGHQTGALLDLKSSVGGDAAIRFQGGGVWTVGNDSELANSFVVSRFNGFPTGTSSSFKKFVISPAGKVGIGNTNPTDFLEVTDQSFPAFKLSDTAGNWGQLSLATNNGFYSPFARTGDMILRAISGSLILNTFDVDGAIRFGTGSSSAGINSEKMTIVSSGDVGIGTTTPETRLHIVGGVRIDNQLAIGIAYSEMPNGFSLGVDGKIICEELRVKNSALWPDYVFDSDYELMPLQQVAAFIKRHHHLPNIPSADEVANEGVDLGQMNAKLLEKVEELTLYLLDLKLENEALKTRVANLENQ